jgi:hypothetical protein
MGHRVGLGIAIVPKGRPIRTDGLPKAPKENPGAKAVGRVYRRMGYWTGAAVNTNVRPIPPLRRELGRKGMAQSRRQFFRIAATSRGIRASGVRLRANSASRYCT